MGAEQSKVMSLGEMETVPLDRVRPYWRNPRRVTEDTVNRLIESIQMYGYQQPIVVDADYVIIVGHTRYAALRRMKVTEIPVKVARDLSEEAVKQYRLIDNKAGEFSSWDFDALVEELSEIDEQLMRTFFPEIGGTGIEMVTDDEVLAEQWDKVNTSVDFICPTCFHQWSQEVTKRAIMSGVIRMEQSE